MDLPIEFTKTALASFDAIQNQIRERFGEKAVKEFEKSTIKTFDILSANPYMFKATDTNPQIRKGLIKKVHHFFTE